MTKLNLLSLLALVIVSFSNIKAQTVEGVVMNKHNEPLGYASVVINQNKSGTVTDEAGKFKLSNIPVGEIKVTASYIGYKKQTKTIKTTPGAEMSLQFILETTDTNLTGIDVFGNKSEDYPGEVKEIDRSFLERTQAIDIKDIFIAEPSVTIGGGGRNAQRIYMRGIEGSNLKISIDGAAQGQSLFQHRGGIGGLDPSLLKQVEVAALSGADNGPGNLGGSIAFETVDAQDMIQDRQRLGASVRAGFSSVSEGYRGGGSVYGMLNKTTGLLLDISGDDQEDYRTGDGDFALYTAAEDWNFLAKLSILNNKRSALRGSFSHNENAGHYITGGAGSDMGAPTEEQEASYQEMDRSTYNFDYRLAQGNNWINLRVNANYNERNLENKDSEIDVNSKKWTAGIKNKMTLDAGILDNSFTFGADYESEDGTSRSAEALGNEKITNTSSNTGLFIQGESTIKIFTLLYGARLDNYESDMGPKNISGDEISPNISARCSFFNNLTAFAGYTEAVRASGIIPVQWMANIYEETNFNDGNPFEPESSAQQEAGLEYEKNNLFLAKDHFAIGATYFKTTISNLIEREGGGGGPVTAIRNMPLDLISEGYELKAAWKTDKLTSSLSFIHVDTEDEDGNAVTVSRRKAASMGDRFTGDINFQINKEMQVGYTLYAVAKLTDIYESDRPGYTIHNIQMQWHFSSVEGLKAALAVNNLFNKTYSEQTSIARGESIVTEPGRDIRVSLSYTF
jgi:hemoglobin/transferrin/lactoferrin receptor protein